MSLLVSVIQAKNLAPMDRSGSSDPYVVVKSSFNKQQFKTQVVEQSLDPIWNEDFIFHNPIASEKLIFKVWDRDLWTPDDFLGELDLPLSDLLTPTEQKFWKKLDKEPKTKKNSAPGELLLKVVYQSEGGPAQSKPKAISDSYVIGKVLGEGGFALVKECQNKQTKAQCAVKIIRKDGLPEEELELLQREINIMTKLSHPNIVRLIEVFDEPSHLYLILELIKGGELFDKIIEKGYFTEKEAQNVTRQVVGALAYMHSHGIVHRDLKPENLLCEGTSIGNLTIKIADFGLSKEGDDLRTSCGSPGYVAPEVLKGNEVYDNTVDIWSVGIITYILLCGYPPFSSSNPDEYLRRILHAQYDFPASEWSDVSDTAKDFIKRILVPTPGSRPSAKTCLQHPWLVQPGSDKVLKGSTSFKKPVL